MKYSVAVLAFAAGVFALPQDASITSAPAASASLTPAVSCIQNCKADDVNCQAACQGIARPNSSQAVETNECAAKCDQGDGSPSDTAAYAKCQQDCFASLFPSTQTDGKFGNGGAASAASSAASSAAASVTSAVKSAASSGASAASSAAESATGSDSPSDSASATESGAQSTESPGAASANSVKIAGAGLAGLMAIFAL